MEASAHVDVILWAALHAPLLIKIPVFLVLIVPRVLQLRPLVNEADILVFEKVLDFFDLPLFYNSVYLIWHVYSEDSRLTEFVCP